MRLRPIALLILPLALGLLAVPLSAEAQPEGVGSLAAGKFVIFNFDDADIETVIHAASGIVGFNYVLAPEVRGKVTVRTSTRIPQGGVFDVLLAILEVHGFTAVKSAALYKIIKIEGAQRRPVPTVFGALPDPGRGGDEIITQIVPIRFVSVADLAKLLQSLISGQGSVIPYRETSLLITDSASNIRRLLEMVRLVDVEGPSAGVQVMPLKHADAQDLAEILNQLFAPGPLRQSGAPVVVPHLALSPQSQVPLVEPRGPKRPPFIAAYPGTNIVIVKARKADIEAIRQLIAQLDVDIYAGRRIFIYFAEHARAKDLAKTLNAIYGQVQAPSATPEPSRPPGALPPREGRPAPSREAPELTSPESHVRFIPDETTNALIVIMAPRDRLDNEEIRTRAGSEPRQSSPERADGSLALGDPLIRDDPCQVTARRAGGPSSRLDRGFVLIDASPLDARVCLDGRLLGAARQLVARAFPVALGRHAVEIISPGFKPYRAQFLVRRSFPTRLRVVLEPE